MSNPIGQRTKWSGQAAQQENQNVFTAATIATNVTIATNATIATIAAQASNLKLDLAVFRRLETEIQNDCPAKEMKSKMTLENGDRADVKQ